jgi:hypothetical protein
MPVAGLSGCGDDDPKRSASQPSGAEQSPTDPGAATTGRSDRSHRAVADAGLDPDAVQEQIRRGPVDPRANPEGSRPSTGCESAPGERSPVRPPVPAIYARLREAGVQVRWRFPRVQPVCQPEGILVTLNPVASLAVVSGLDEAGGAVRVSGREGGGTIAVPESADGPFQVRVSSISDRGIRSRVLTVPVR